jgi:S-adenosylmethionine/arginine decarboxylase-like enzyme
MYGRRRLGRINAPDVLEQKSVGIHYIVDIDDMQADLITNNKRLIEICDEALKLGEMTILKNLYIISNPMD